tara:strand:- start:525 stop:1637 length:1113 start_codon:yes stop_codon:yes gene_type:complete
MFFSTRLPNMLRIVLSTFLFVLFIGICLNFNTLIQISTNNSDSLTTDSATLFFAEFGWNEDLIYEVSSTNPDDKKIIHTVEHSPGFGLNPAINTHQGKIAYLVLPKNVAPSRSSAAELWIFNTNTQQSIRLARDADINASPVLRNDGEVVIYRSSKNIDGSSIIEVNLDTRTRKKIHTDNYSFGIIPVGFNQKNEILFARFNTNGTDLLKINEQRELSILFHASDEIARDWRIDPSGKNIAFLAPQLLGERIVHRAQLMSLNGHKLNMEIMEGVSEQYAPAWRQDGALAVGTSMAPLVIDSHNSIIIMPPEQGFDVPLGWSPDGNHLAVRHFDGIDSYTPGNDSLVVIRHNKRMTIHNHGELIFLGWNSA